MSDHPIFKLGKAPAKPDSRNLMFAAISRKAMPPASWDFDLTHTGIPTPMFKNDILGDCVIAGRAHQTLRFERIEQNATLKITDLEVSAEYFQETGGGDDGLVVLDSLNAWRRRGWRAAGSAYKIMGFAAVDFKAPDAVKRAIVASCGIGLGVDLPVSAQAQTQTGQPWAVVGKDSKKGSWGGHYIYVCGYNATGPVCVTWGRKQQMTWDWLAKYGDEAYAIIDAKNTSKAIDHKALAEFLLNK